MHCVFFVLKERDRETKAPTQRNAARGRHTHRQRLAWSVKNITESEKGREEYEIKGKERHRLVEDVCKIYRYRERVKNIAAQRERERERERERGGGGVR